MGDFGAVGTLETKIELSAISDSPWSKKRNIIFELPIYVRKWA